MPLAFFAFGFVLLGAGCEKPSLLDTVAAKISEARLFTFSGEAPVHSFAALLPEDCQKSERYNVTTKACALVCANSSDCAAKEAAITAKAQAIWNKYINADREQDSFDVDEETSIMEYSAGDGKIKLSDRPTVPAALKKWQKDKNKLQRPWKLFTTLFPKGVYDIVDGYVVYTDGNSKSAASLAPGDSANGTYTLYVDIADAFPNNNFDPGSLTYYFIHEFGHVLTLNQNEQAGYDENSAPSDTENEESDTADESSDCSAYTSMFGCMRNTSYINTFYNRFWKASWAEYKADEQDGYDAALKEQTNDWYSKHPDWFVTDYAAVNPEEDMAESWSAFVLKDKPTGSSIADQKILFFYDYPELVHMRDAIRHRLIAASGV